MPARGPGYSRATASLGTVLRETHKGRSWLTTGPGQLPPGLRCPPESSTPPRGQRPSRAEAGASGSLGTSVWRLRVPCPPAPPPHQGGQGPQHRPPCPCGSPACRETPRASGARWPSWVLFLQWGRLLQEPRFSLGGLSGDSGPTGLAPSKRPQGSPDPGLREVLVAASPQRAAPSGPPPVTSADSGAGRSEGSKGWVHSGCQGWGLPPARTRMSAPRHAGPCPPLGSRPLGGSLGTPRAQCVPASPGGSGTSVIKAPAEASAWGDWSPCGPPCADRSWTAPFVPPPSSRPGWRGRVGAGRAAAVPRTARPPGPSLCRAVLREQPRHLKG